MTRSYRHTPISGWTTSSSNKLFKRYENRRMRRASKMAVHTEKEILPHPKEYGNEWASPRDGKGYWNIRDDQWVVSCYAPMWNINDQMTDEQKSQKIKEYYDCFLKMMRK